MGDARQCRPTRRRQDGQLAPAQLQGQIRGRGHAGADLLRLAPGRKRRQDTREDGGEEDQETAVAYRPTHNATASSDGEHAHGWATSNGQQTTYRLFPHQRVSLDCPACAISGILPSPRGAARLPPWLPASASRLHAGLA